MEWGQVLFDRYDELMKHLTSSIDFLDLSLRMNTERMKIENEYAKNLKKMASRYTMKKMNDYGGQSLTYENSYNKSMQEINSIALQHEVIAENLKKDVMDETLKTIQDMKKLRAHSQSEFNKLEKTMKKTSDALDNSLKRYRTAHADMIKAEESYKAAEENRNLPRVEVDRQKQYAESKRRECETIKSDYAAQLGETNKIRTNYFTSTLPKLLNELQTGDKLRTEQFTQYLKAVAESERSVMHTITNCLDGIVSASNDIDWPRDSNTIVDALRSGYAIPDEIQFIDLDTLQSTNSLDSLNLSQGSSGTIRSKKTERGTFPWFKSKQKEDDNLGPEQKRKKISKAIKETTAAINSEEKSKNSMMRLMKTYENNPQNAQAVQVQINESSQKLAGLREELERLEDQMRQLGGTVVSQGSPNGQVSGSNSSRASMISAGQPQTDNRKISVSSSRSDDDDDFPDGEFDTPTPTTSASEPPAEAAAPIYVGGCIALYPFDTEDGTGFGMREGDQFYILQSDHGDGWTMVTSLDGKISGYVPSNYLEITLY